MPTFIIENNLAFKGPVHLNKDDEHHLLRVLRVKPGETFRVTDNHGKYAVLKIIGLKPFSFELLKIADGESPAPITVHLPLIEQDRMEWAIEKLTELNIATVQPVITDFCQARELRSRQFERLCKISVAAQKQCGRTTPLNILPPVTLQKITLPPGTVKIVANQHARDNVPTVFKKINQQDWTGIFVGPEGGFSPEEEMYFDSGDFVQVRLGGTILRSETAAVVMVGLRLYLRYDRI